MVAGQDGGKVGLAENQLAIALSRRSAIRRFERAWRNGERPTARATASFGADGRAARVGGSSQGAEGVRARGEDEKRRGGGGGGGGGSGRGVDGRGTKRVRGKKKKGKRECEREEEGSRN